MFSQLLTRVVDSIKEATFADIHRKQKTITTLFPAHPGRVEKVGHMGGVRIKKILSETWKFDVHSGTKKSTWYNGVIHWIKILPTLENLVKDRRLWVRDGTRVDLRLLASAFRNECEVQIECNCPCQQWWGFNYILSKDKYNAKYGDGENRAPNVRNPHQYGAMCKHLEALFKTMPFYNSTIARWLNDFYGKDIEDMENKATAESEKFKKVGTELGKRVEKPGAKPKEKPKEQPKEQPKPEQKAEEEKPEEEKKE